MIFNKHVFFGLLLFSYAVALFTTFEALGNPILILSIALLCVGGWLYGQRIGYLLLILITLINLLILTVVSGEPDDILQGCNPVGLILGMVVMQAAGLLHEKQDKLNELRANLGSRVDEATAELDKLARELIGKEEQERIQIGQDLHDGVGQYLTGMLLHCEALSVSLKEGNRSEAGLAEWMTRRIQNNIQTVRQLSRSLLPIRFTETNLETAMDEMAAYFGSVSAANVRLECHGDSTCIPFSTAQHLHRIAQETIYRAIFEHKATDLDIKLTIQRHDCQIQINGEGIPSNLLPSSAFVSKVMEYRLRAIGGNQSFTRTPNGGFRLNCMVDFGKETG